MKFTIKEKMGCILGDFLLYVRSIKNDLKS